MRQLLGRGGFGATGAEPEALHLRVKKRKDKPEESRLVCRSIQQSMITTAIKIVRRTALKVAKNIAHMFGAPERKVVVQCKIPSLVQETLQRSHATTEDWWCSSQWWWCGRADLISGVTSVRCIISEDDRKIRIHDENAASPIMCFRPTMSLRKSTSLSLLISSSQTHWPNLQSPVSRLGMT